MEHLQSWKTQVNTHITMRDYVLTTPSQGPRRKTAYRQMGRKDRMYLVRSDAKIRTTQRDRRKRLSESHSLRMNRIVSFVRAAQILTMMDIPGWCDSARGY